MRITPIFIIVLLRIQPVIAEEPTVESLALKIEILEQKVETLSSQVAASSRKVQLAPAPESVAQGEIIINVLADGQLRVAGKIIDDAEFAKRLAAVVAHFPNQPIIIRGDKETKYQNIVRVIVLCRKSGIWNIAFAITKTADEPQR